MQAVKKGEGGGGGGEGDRQWRHMQNAANRARDVLVSRLFPEENPNNESNNQINVFSLALPVVYTYFQHRLPSFPLPPLSPRPHG